jgi:hypothetical protein
LPEHGIQNVNESINPAQNTLPLSVYTIQNENPTFKTLQGVIHSLKDSNGNDNYAKEEKERARAYIEYLRDNKKVKTTDTILDPFDHTTERRKRALSVWLDDKRLVYNSQKSKMVTYNSFKKSKFTRKKDTRSSRRDRR